MIYTLYPHPHYYFLTLSKLTESRFFFNHPPIFNDDVTLYHIFFWRRPLELSRVELSQIELGLGFDNFRALPAQHHMEASKICLIKHSNLTYFSLKEDEQRKTLQYCYFGKYDDPYTL